MIQKIKFNKDYKSIPMNFEIDLKKLTVITGENNSGKTNFIEKVSSKKDVSFIENGDENENVEIIYFPADNINPTENECKSSVQGSGFIKNLTKLFNNLNIDFKLENKNETQEIIESLINETNKNLEKINGNKNYELKANFKEDLKKEVILQAIIEKIISKEFGENRNIEDLGQGIQRLIVVSILKAYKDLLKNKNLNLNKQFLILFEEPEIFLHPKLKRKLNSVLEEISNEENYQIIITTHDPYFAFKNLDLENEKIIYSFVKDKNITKKSGSNIINGIEDELLFISLYSKLAGKIKNPQKFKELLNSVTIFENPRKYFKNNWEGNIPDLEYIRHSIHHLGDNPYTLGLISCENNCQKNNYYTEDELKNGINILCKFLN
jgi:predicted ATPase